MSAEGLRLGTPRYWLANAALLTAGFATFAALYDVQPLLPALAAQFDVSPATASLALSVTTIALAWALLVAGSVSESWGRKLPMVVSLALSASITFACALAPTFGALVTLRLIEGLALSGLPAVAMAYLGEEVSPDALGLAMGLYVAGTALGGMCGRLLVGVVADVAGWRWALAAIGMLGVVCALGVHLLLPASRNFAPRRQTLRQHVGAFRAHVGDAGLPWLYAMAFLLAGGFVTIYNYLGFRLALAPFSLSQSAIGTVFVVYIAGMVASTIMGRIADRYGRRNVLWISTVVMLGGALVTLAGSLLGIVLGMIVMTFGFFGAHSIASSWVGRRALANKSHASALYLFAYYAGSSIVGSLGGIVYARLGWGGTVAGVALVLLAALGIAAGVLREVTPVRRPDAPEAAQTTGT